jgi:hypothetical protein
MRLGGRLTYPLKDLTPGVVSHIWVCEMVGYRLQEESVRDEYLFVGDGNPGIRDALDSSKSIRGGREARR